MLSCRVYLLHKWPAMREVRWAYSWKKDQDLRILYPNGVPMYVIQGVLSFDDGVNQSVDERIKAAKKDG